MATTIESEIRRLFADFGNPALVAEHLLKRWDANVLSDEDIRGITRFMIQANLHAALLIQIRRCLKRDMRVPWSGFAEALKQAEIKLEPLEVDAFFEGLNSQTISFDSDMMLDLVESTGLDGYDPRPADYRHKRTLFVRHQHAEKRADLMRRLEYARVNRLISQEKRLLDELQAFDPSDPELSREKNLFAFREAQEIVENALAHSPPKSEIERKFSRLSPDVQEAAKPIIQAVKEKAKLATQQGAESEIYDLALMLIFMELHEDGVAILEENRSSQRIDWLLLETLIAGRKFAAALGEVEKLEVKYAGDPESPFALTYARARALWGLGETVTAIELMKSLTRVRPSYRSATTLLQQWIEEAP
ncbi:MAG: hypothetical protein RBT63_09505 [Bdellovibrionales bacterium]|nr:hypothetical protein [Bdellovibrionales bacterium]